MQQANSSRADRGPGLGLRLPRAAVPTESWGPWAVVPRTNGFHVSRESANGTRTEALTNDVGRTKVFRKRELAVAACDGANRQAGRITLDGTFATAIIACLFAAALCWLGPVHLDGAPTYESYGYKSPNGLELAVAASRAGDVEACQRMHGPNATAIHLPDGQHRCTDKRGRNLSTRSGIVLAHEVQP